uniref:Uncharacterized protein n=1 Tax=Trichuris muris TaxID=70415 RepID=A0A5S6QMA0_TRIMR
MSHSLFLSDRANKCSAWQKILHGVEGRSLFMPPERVCLPAEASSSTVQSPTVNDCLSSSLNLQSDNSRANGSGITVAQPRLHRQVAFGIPLQTVDSFAEESESLSPQCGSARSSFATFRGGLLRLVYTFDSTSICYLTIAILMMSVGVVITIVTAKEDAFRVSMDAEGNSPQLWIVGPIFICSGLLIFAKAASRIYQHLLRPSTRSANGLLSSDSRPSLTTVSIPPSYSMALNAPVPCSVLEEDNKSFTRNSDDIDPDSDSLQLVTLNFDPPPPSYDEAMKYSSDRSSIAVPLQHGPSLIQNSAVYSSQHASAENLARNIFWWLFICRGCHIISQARIDCVRDLVPMPRYLRITCCFIGATLLTCTGMLIMFSSASSKFLYVAETDHGHRSHMSMIGLILTLSGLVFFGKTLAHIRADKYDASSPIANLNSEFPVLNSHSQSAIFSSGSTRKVTCADTNSNFSLVTRSKYASDVSPATTDSPPPRYEDVGEKCQACFATRISSTFP